MHTTKEQEEIISKIESLQEEIKELESQLLN